VIKAYFVHSRWCLSGNSSAKIPELPISWCSISRTVRTYASVDQGGFPVQAAINLLRSSLRTPAVCFTVNWPPSASIWIYSHPIACCFSFLLIPVLRTIFKWAAWVKCLVAALAASRLTDLCLRSCCVPRYVRIWCSACQSANIRSVLTWRRWLCIHDELVWNSRGRW